GQGPARMRNVGDSPQSEHRSTKKSVKLLLSNLRTGASKTKDTDTTEEDINKVVFNAVDLLIKDKVVESKKARLDVLTKFESALDLQFAAQSNKKGALDNAWKDRIKEAVQALQRKAQADIVLDKSEDPNTRDKYRKEMLKSDEGKQALAAGLSSINPASLKDFKFEAAFGKDKDHILAEARERISNKYLASVGPVTARKRQRENARFVLQDMQYR